ncbi:MAG: trypsin-like peptidase domain-containing protein [candidate division Zixibacteria bacterium]|nr:trypsin-like peptidase domain-containing protein [candidate division Zixibacteria bacterium]
MDLDYLEYYVVPVLAVPRGKQNLFRFLGTGFFVGAEGHLVTCAHVVQNITSDEALYCFQIGRHRWIPLSVFRVLCDHDLALCTGAVPKTKEVMPLISEPFIQPGADINTLGYLHEPKGPDRLSFCRRVMRGYITSIPESSDYPDSYELSFPVLFGCSGAPLLSRFDIEGESKSKLGIVGCVYGSRESRIVRHSEITREFSGTNKLEREREVTARIEEMGLAYNVKALLKLFEESEITITVYPGSLIDEIGLRGKVE